MAAAVRYGELEAICVDASDLIDRRGSAAQVARLSNPDTPSAFNVANPVRRAESPSKFVDGINHSQPPGAVGKHSPSCQ
jgi:hypothetical protein